MGIKTRVFDFEKLAIPGISVDTYIIDHKKIDWLTDSTFPHLIPKVAAEAFQIFLQDAHVLPIWLSYEEYCQRGGKPIAVWLQSFSGKDAVNPLVAFYDIRWRKREVGTILSLCPGHHTKPIEE
jgi:hypothetical protein